MPNLILKMFYFFKYMKKNNKNIFLRCTIKVNFHYPDKLVAYLILIIFDNLEGPNSRITNEITRT